MDTRNNKQGALSAPGNDFWRLVWKRIESSRSKADRSAQTRDLSLEPPLDYAVEADRQIQAGPADRSRA